MPKINIWTKILVVDGQQVLVYKEYDRSDEDDIPYKVKSMSQHKGQAFTISRKFGKEDIRDLYFDDYQSEYALKHLEEARAVFIDTDTEE